MNLKSPQQGPESQNVSTPKIKKNPKSFQKGEPQGAHISMSEADQEAEGLQSPTLGHRF